MRPWPCATFSRIWPSYVCVVLATSDNFNLFFQAQEKKTATSGDQPDSKAKAMKRLESDEKKGKLSTVKEDKSKAKGVKSSTAFFTQLQQEATSAVKAKKGASKKKNGEQTLKARSLKL